MVTEDGMNAVTRLRVRESRGHNVRTFQPMAGISHTLNGVAGIGLPKTSGIMGRVQQRGFFMPVVCSMAGRGRGQQCPPMLVSVDQPEPDRHPLIGLRGRRDTTRHSSNIMNTSHQGAQHENYPAFMNAG